MHWDMRRRINRQDTVIDLLLRLNKFRRVSSLELAQLVEQELRKESALKH